MKIIPKITIALPILAIALFHPAEAKAQNEILFEDNFTDPQESSIRWTLKDGDPWDIEDNMLILQPNSKIEIKDSAKWSNFTFSCKLKLLESVEGKNQQVGVMIAGSYIFIGTDEDRFNYASNGTVVDKKIDAANKGGWHNLKVVCRPDHISVYFDDGEAIIKSMETEEAISLKTHNIKAAFSEVRVVENSAEEVQTSANLLSNSSFERNNDPTLPDYWGPALSGLVDGNMIAQREELFENWKSRSENPYHGDRAMRVGMLPVLYSTMVSLKSGLNYTFSAYLKGESDGMAVEMIFADWTTPHQTKYLTKEVKLTKEWQRYEFPMGTIVGNKGFCGFKSLDKTKGAFWVDAVQLQTGDVATEYEPASVDTLSGPGGQAALPEITANKASQAPTMDGSLSDAMWQEAAKTDLVLTTGATPGDKTESYIAYDKDNLYIGFKCYDSRMNDVREKIEKRDGLVWLDDAVEIFLNPSNRENYYHLGVSVTGAQYDALKSNPKWNGEWEAKTKKFADRWECEIRIPFKSLDLSTFDRGDWKLNLGRENPKASEWSAWSPTFNSGFHSEKHFGKLKAFPEDISVHWVKEAPKTVGNHNAKPYPLQYKGKPFLGYGIYWTQSSIRQFPVDKNVFEALRKAGMNLLFITLQPGDYTPDLNIETELRAMLEMADSYDIGVVICFWYTDQPRPENVPIVKTVINKLKDAKGILAWAVLDEPHDHADVIKEVIEAAKAADPSRPTFINLTPQGVGMQIGGLPGDIICADRYGIGFDGSTISDVGTLAKEQMDVASERKLPAWQILQNMSNWLWVERVVTPAEMTAQTYEALVKGITGISYFAGFPVSQATWQRQIEIGAEIRRLEPILLSHEFGNITSSNRKINHVCKLWNGDYYLIAVNPHYEAMDTEFDIASLEKDGSLSIKNFFDDSTIVSNSQKLAVKFKPLERICYKLGPARPVSGQK